MIRKLFLLFLFPIAACFGKNIYVDCNAPAGGDGSKAAPFNAVQLAADRVSPGDTVVINPGVYFETVRLKRFGTKNAPVTFRADNVKKNRVIITGADKAVRLKEKKWQLHDKKNGIWYVKPDNIRPPRVLYSGTDLFPYKTLEALKTFEARPGVPGPRHGFYFQKSSGKLFVRLRPDGKYGPTDPNKHTMAIAATREEHLAIEKADSRSYNFGILGKPGTSLNVIIDGITFETPARTAVYVCGNDVTVKNCLFLGCMAGGVTGRYIGEDKSDRIASSSKNITVERCEWHNFPIYDDVAELIDIVKTGKFVIKNEKDKRHHHWVHKSPTNGTLIYYETGIIRNIGKNWVLRNCYIHDVFDGIANMNWAENTVIEDNLFEKCIDNAIETENHSKNCHIRRNRFVDIFQSLSYQPLGGTPWAGPVYIYQNLAYRTPANIFRTGSSSTIKIGVVSKQAKNRHNAKRADMQNYDWANVTIPGFHVFNNTFVEPGIRLIGDLDSQKQKLKNVTFSNNIVVSSALSYNLRRPGDAGVKVYQYTNNQFVFTASTKVYPLFPAVKAQVAAKDPADVLPGYKEFNFVPAKFSASAEVSGMPAKFKYAGAIQSADDKIAPAPGIAEEDVPEVKAAPAVKRAVPAGKATALQADGKQKVRLEWCVSGKTEEFYEVKFDRRRLEKRAGFPAGCSFGVSAVIAGAEKSLPVTSVSCPEDGDVLLRFKVPAGTQELYLFAAKGKTASVDSSKIDNLLAGILDDAKLWRGNDVSISRSGSGILIAAKKHGHVIASSTVDVPEECRGRSAAFDLDVKSVNDLSYGSFIRLAQLGKNGKKLSESVTDPRWISHMRPPQVKSSYRVYGVIHPQAEKLKLEITLSTKNIPFDNFGRPLKNPQAHLAKMEISHAAVRCAEQMVFPRYNDRNFAGGVSGKAGDHSLRLHPSTAFTHVTTSHATWGEDKQIRNSKEWFWPNADGTVECYFKPAKKNGKITLFDASNVRNSINGQYHGVRNSTFSLTWNSEKNSAVIIFKDNKDKVHKGSFKFPMQTGKWNHVACQWSCSSGLSVYLNGKKVFSKSGKIAPIDLEKIKYPSTRMPQNFSVGATVKVARGHFLRDDKFPKFEGDIDLLRISDVVRYKADFTPAEDFTVDAATRALYKFDRSFTGFSGGGICRMLGTYDSPSNILDNEIECGNKKVEYYSPVLLPENDPDKAICRLNYPVLPTAEQARSARKTVQKSYMMTPGKTLKLDIPSEPYMDFIEISAGKNSVKHPLVINSGEIDCRSFGDIARSLLGDKLSEKEKMYRIFNFMIYASDYFTSHQIDFPADSDQAVRSATLALTMLNIYCGFNCGPLNDMLANIFTCSAGTPATRTFGFGHSFQQVYYGGKNRLYDLSAQRFFPTESLIEAASLEDAEFSPNVLRALGTTTDPRRNTFGPDHYIRLTTKMKVLQDPGFQQRVAYDLRPGEKMRIYFNNSGLFNDLQSFMFKDYFKNLNAVKSLEECSETKGSVIDFNAKVRNRARLKVYQSQRVFPHYSNAFLMFDGKPAKSNPAFGKFTASSFCYRIDLPYTVTAANYRALSNGKPVPMSISTDGGKTYHKLDLDADGTARLDYEVRARHGYWLRIEKPVSEVEKFTAATAMMLNSRVQTGKLRKGANELQFVSDTPQAAKVTIQYRVDAGKIEISGDVYSGAIPGNERQLAVVEPGKSLILDVKGAGSQTKVETYGKVKASYINGKLTVSADSGAGQEFACVMLNDNGRKKELTILISPDVRLITPANGMVSGKGTKFVSASGERLQRSLYFGTVGNQAKVNFAPLAGGKYNIWVLCRIENVSSRMPLLAMTSADGTRVEACRTINHTTDLYKAQFGKGEFGRFRWDCVFALSHGAFFYDIPKAFTLASGTSSFDLASIRKVKFEVAGILILPKASREFQTRMAKVLSGINCEPWKIQSDGIDVQ